MTYGEIRLYINAILWVYILSVFFNVLYKDRGAGRIFTYLVPLVLGFDLALRLVKSGWIVF